MKRATTTNRGFRLVEFRDIYDAPCSIQESSGATHALWLGCEHETIHKTTGEKCGARMLIDRELAQDIINKLQRWLDTGELK